MFNEREMDLEDRTLSLLRRVGYRSASLPKASFNETSQFRCDRRMGEDLADFEIIRRCTVDIRSHDLIKTPILTLCHLGLISSSKLDRVRHVKSLFATVGHLMIRNKHSEELFLDELINRKEDS